MCVSRGRCVTMHEWGWVGLGGVEWVCVCVCFDGYGLGVFGCVCVCSDKGGVCLNVLVDGLCGWRMCRVVDMLIKGMCVCMYT